MTDRLSKAIAGWMALGASAELAQAFAVSDDALLWYEHGLMRELAEKLDREFIKDFHEAQDGDVAPSVTAKQTQKN